MQVSIENTSSLGRRLTIAVPAVQIKTEVDGKMNELSRTARVDGFRPGKAPQNLIKQRFGNQARQEAIGKVIEISLSTALDEQKLKPAGRPVVERIINESDQDLEYIVTFEIFPEIKLAPISELKLEKYHVEVQEADIDKAIENFRQQFAEWIVVERPAKQGDKLTVDYVSTLNGKPYENNQGKDVSVELGSGLFIPGFEEGLIGASQGDEHVLELTFPEEWRMEKLAGKLVEFRIKVKAITEKKLADIDAAFAKKLGAESAEPEVIRNKVKQNLEKWVSNTVETRLRDEVIEKLIKANPVELPKALIEQEVAILHEELHRQMGDQAHEDCSHQGLEGQAKNRVALGLVLNELIKQENLVLDKQRVQNKINELSKRYGNAGFVESMYYESEELLNSIRNTVLIEQAIDLVLSKVTVLEKPSTVDKLLNPKSE